MGQTSLLRKLGNSYFWDIDLRRQLANSCDAPFGTEEDVKVKIDAELKAVKSAAKALLTNNKRIPEKRLAEMRGILSDYYGVELVDDEVCKRGLNLESKIINEAYVPHGRRVVDFFVSNGDGILLLEQIWRQNFLDTMTPKYLPPFWSVNHQQQRLDVKYADKRIDPEDYRAAVGSRISSEKCNEIVTKNDLYKTVM